MGLPQWMWIWHMSMVTSVMVPFGILLHYWRRTNATYTVTSEDSPSAEVHSAVRRQVFLTRIASAVAFVVVILSLEGVWLPSPVSDHWTSFVVPLSIATLCIVVILLAATTYLRRNSAQQAIQPSSSTTLYFGRRWWLTGWIAIAAGLIASVVVAGLASSADSDGRYAVITVENEEFSGSSTILGWYFGIPILIGVAVLVTVTVVALRLGTRSPLSGDRQNVDWWLRRHRTRTVLLIGAGALVLTLGWALISIGGAASLVASGPSGVPLSPPFAALSGPLRVTGLVLQGVGVAMFLVPVFTKQPRRVPAVSAAPVATADALVP